MKVVFLQKDSFVKIAVMQLSAILKDQGHQCDIFIESGEKKFIKKAIECQCDLYAFSCTTGQEKWVYEVAEKLKAVNAVPIIMGGPHPTFYPESIKNPFIDYICRGEGEGALSDVVECLAEGRPDRIQNIANIWAKDSAGNIYKNDVRNFVEDLDSNPLPDFSIYKKYPYLIPYNQDMYPVMASRGCPYNCSYCFNKKFKEIYRGKGKYLRRKSPQYIAQEILDVMRNHGVKKINFVDDSLFSHPEWLKEFSFLYEKQIQLPCIINIEATQVTEELVTYAKNMGCICVRMGLETGNENLRNKILGKKITNEQIQHAARLVKRAGIYLSTYNILGLPGETLENSLETYTLNRNIQSDFMQCAFLQPYPGTDICKLVIESGYMTADNADLEESFFASTKLKLENEKEIVNLQRLMQIMAKMNFSVNMVRKIISLPGNPLFQMLFKCSFVYSKIRTQHMKIIPLIRLGLHSLSYMKGRS